MDLMAYTFFNRLAHILSPHLKKCYSLETVAWTYSDTGSDTVLFGEFWEANIKGERKKFSKKC